MAQVAFTKYKHVRPRSGQTYNCCLKLKTFQFGVDYIALASSSAAAATVSQKAFFEVGIRPKKVTSASSSGHGTKAVAAATMHCIIFDAWPHEKRGTGIVWFAD